MSKSELLGEAGSAVAKVIHDAAEGGDGAISTAAKAVQSMLADAGEAVRRPRATLSLAGNNLALARERLDEGGVVKRVRGAHIKGNLPDGDTDVVIKPSRGAARDEGRTVGNGGISSWHALDGAPNPLTGKPVRITENTTGLNGIADTGAADAGAAKVVERPLRPPVEARPLTAEERLPTRNFETRNDGKTVVDRDGVVITSYSKAELPFKFTDAKGFPITSGQDVTMVAQHETGPMRGWTTLANPMGIEKIGSGSDKGAHYLGGNPTLSFDFQKPWFQQRFSATKETGVPAWIHGDDTSWLRAEANSAKGDKPTMAFINPKGELAGLQWPEARAMQNGPFKGLTGTEINVRDGQMTLINKEEPIGNGFKTYTFEPKAPIDMETRQPWETSMDIKTKSVVPKSIAKVDGATAIEGDDANVIVEQRLFPRDLMNIKT